MMHTVPDELFVIRVFSGPHVTMFNLVEQAVAEEIVSALDLAMTSGEIIRISHAGQIGIYRGSDISSISMESQTEAAWNNAVEVTRRRKRINDAWEKIRDRIENGPVEVTTK